MNSNTIADDWEQVESVEGRLTKFNKIKKRITIEVKEYLDSTPLIDFREYDLSDGFSVQNYQRLAECVGKIVIVKLVDEEVTDVHVK